MEAYVLIRTHGREKELQQYLESIPLVKEAKIVYGEYDIILHVVAEDMRELTHLVLDDIRQRFDIDRTSTLIVAED
ncbi:MAG: Lrp/AsnC family transcriptional regulator [Candidatus Diapherotrites archaeon]|nr:Lrp/AsnC family transcriptional regulator [Candidatus Diapherotrites archaeon]